MGTIFKTGTKNTYFEGMVTLRDNTNNNWAHPIDFPTIFTAFGAGIRSGNWQSCTATNTPDYVIKEYFNNRKGSLSLFRETLKTLENISWLDVENKKDFVLSLINIANNELLKLPTLK